MYYAQHIRCFISYFNSFCLKSVLINKGFSYCAFYYCSKQYRSFCLISRIHRLPKQRNMVSHALSIENEMIRGRGRMEVILGPMFSGKTTELIRRIRRYQLAHFRCLVIKYAGDCRYSATEIATHDLRTLSAVSCTSLTEYKNKAMEYEVVGIDEGQFFPDLIDFAESLANAGKIVLIAALDGTYQRTAFGDVLNLVPLAENIIKLSAICMVCYNNASFTKRISHEKAVEIIGGADKYMAVCRECYHMKGSVKNDSQRAALMPLYQNNKFNI